MYRATALTSHHAIEASEAMRAAQVVENDCLTRASSYVGGLHTYPFFFAPIPLSFSGRIPTLYKVPYSSYQSAVLTEAGSTS